MRLKPLETIKWW